MHPRAIIHLNIADFAAGIETSLAPAFKNEPLVIAPTGAPRAVVYDMNEAAFKEGVRKGMALSQVMRHHRGIPVLPPRPDRYEQVMEKMARTAAAFTPAVEAGILDGHLFLDITGTGRLYGPPPDVAFRLKKTINHSLGLDPIWSIATSKLVAKVASRVVKPAGEYIVGPGEEEAFLAPLPVSLLPGLTPSEIQTVTRFNLVRVSQVRALTAEQLDIPFPGRAAQVMRLLKGIDSDPVLAARPGSTVKTGHEFTNDTNDADELRAGVAMAAAHLSARLCRGNRTFKDLTITISHADGVCCTRSQKGRGRPEPDLFKPAWALFTAAWHRRVRIRHISLACTAAPATPVQADLFSTAPDQTRRASHLATAMNGIRSRFGTAALLPAAALALS